MLAQVAPQGHQPEIGDLAVHEREYPPGLIVGMQPDRLRPPSTTLYRQTHFRPIPPLFNGFHDLGVRDVHLADAPQGVADDRPLGRELRVVGKVLELAAAAAILREVLAGRRDAAGDRLEHRLQLTAGEALVQRQAVGLEPHPLPWGRARHEHGPAVGEPPHAIASGGDARDRD